MNQPRNIATDLSTNQINGILAAAIVFAIALGCTCGNDLGFPNQGKPAAN